MFPALSPIPLTVHSIWVAPASTAAIEFATASPKSLWQCTEISTFSIPFILSFKYLIVSYISSGVLYPTVSGIFIVVAPAFIAVSYTSTRYSFSVLIASSAENSTSSTKDFAYLTISSTDFKISSLDIFNLNSLWTGEVAINVCILGLAAFLIASAATSISFLTALAKLVTVEFLIFSAINWIALKSPGEAAAKPASIMSTPKDSNCFAILNFSLALRLTLGVCSPSLNVVSKIFICFITSPQQYSLR